MKLLSYLVMTACLALTSCAHHGAKDCAGKCDLKKKQCSGKKCDLKKEKSDCCK